MKKILAVKGSQNKVSKLEVNVDTVYMRDNIERIETEESVGWQYDETQYTYQEYIEMLAKQEEVKELEYKLLTPSEIYYRLDKDETTLEQLKHYKLNELNELCNTAIIKGFKYNINDTDYLFSASIEAQSNFQATDLLFKEGLIQDVSWSVENVNTGIVERLSLTQELFNKIKLQLFFHVNSQISKFRDILQPQVLSAQSNEEVDIVKW